MFQIEYYLNVSVEDARVYLTKRMNITNNEIARTNAESSVGLNSYSKFEILTSKDLECVQSGIPKITYDAYVLYADEDIDFASDLVKRMEHFGFQVFKKYCCMNLT